jgi:putative transcriptional regulator
MPMNIGRHMEPSQRSVEGNRRMANHPKDAQMTNSATLDAAGVSVSSPKRRPGVPVVDRPSGINIDVQAIRLASKGIGATQRTFADAIGVPVKTVRNWEQRRRKPTGAALVLLMLIQRDPWIVFDVVNGQH